MTLRERMGQALRKQLVEATGDPDLLFADGFDDAIIGVATRCGQPTVVVYDRAKCIDILTKQGLTLKETLEDAEEYFAFNTEGAWMGPRTPAFLVRPDGLE